MSRRRDDTPAPSSYMGRLDEIEQRLANVEAMTERALSAFAQLVQVKTGMRQEEIDVMMNEVMAKMRLEPDLTK